MLAPPAVSVELAPAHTDVGEADAVTVGIELTVTVTDVVFVQPAALVPVTEYIVVLDGVTVFELPLPKL